MFVSNRYSYIIIYVLIKFYVFFMYVIGDICTHTYIYIYFCVCLLNTMSNGFIEIYFSLWKQQVIGGNTFIRHSVRIVSIGI